MLALGGAFEAIDVLKARLVASHAARTRRIESGEQIVVGVNRFMETAPSPLAAQVLPALGRRTCAVIEFDPPPADRPPPRASAPIMAELFGG